MNTLRKTLAAALLIFTLIIPTFAGEIHTGITPPPPPSSSVVIEGETSNSDDAAAYSMTEAAFSLLQSVLTLF